MRVFNGREKAANAKRVVRMEQLEKGSKTFATNPDTEEEKEFKYDYSFQSHDPSDNSIGQYCTQDDVFNILGRPVLGYALGGKNTCLFAYGQTGAGKSFSMLGKVGVPEQEGIIPRTCKAIFSMMDDENGASVRISVDIQVIEIYCEQVNDLLLPRTQWPANGYKPHLTAKDGYVVDTTKKPCFKYDHLNEAMVFADKNRSIGSHDLNPESSRAHTIYQINYSKVVIDETGKAGSGSLTSKLNLVDLAGSERTDSAGTSGQMLKEGNAINRSLTALGGCIKALSEEKKPNFRDSKLTLLLSGSMTNGKVIMIAAVSPADICYQETMSTLRFADRIKQVKIKAKSHVMVDPVEEIKREMEAMRAKMQAEIDALRAGIDPAAGGEEVSRLKTLLEEREREREEILKDLADQRAMLEGGGNEDHRQAQASNITKNWSKAFQGMGVSAKERETQPHFVNLHEDERLNESLVYPIKPGETWVGKANAANPPGIEFNGIGMTQNHVKLVHAVENGHPHVYIEAPPNGDGVTKVNGKKLKGRVELRHQNRVWIGNNYSLRFVFPGQEEAGEGYEKDPDYFFAQSETVESAGQSSALNHKVNEASKKVHQANIIAADLGRDVAFFPKIYKNRFTDEDDVVVLYKVGVPVKAEFLWTWAKFESRVIQMTAMWTEWQALVAKDPAAKLAPRPQREDPFVDLDDQRIGEADAWLASLANMIELEAHTAVLSPFGNVEGKLHLKIMPCDRNGRVGPFDDDDPLDPFVDKPQELLGRDIIFQIQISECLLNVDVEGGQGCRYEKVYVRYKLDMLDDDEPWTETPPDPSSTFNPKFGFTKTHTLKVDKDVLNKLTKGRMTFQVWGKVCDTEKLATTGAAGDRAKRAEEFASLQTRLEKVKKALGPYIVYVCVCVCHFAVIVPLPLLPLVHTLSSCSHAHHLLPLSLFFFPPTSTPDSCKECPNCKYDLTKLLEGV